MGQMSEAFITSAITIPKRTKQERLSMRETRRQFFQSIRPRGVPEFTWKIRQSGYAGPLVMQAQT